MRDTATRRTGSRHTSSRWWRPCLAKRNAHAPIRGNARLCHKPFVPQLDFFLHVVERGTHCRISLTGRNFDGEGCILGAKVLRKRMHDGLHGQGLANHATRHTHRLAWRFRAVQQQHTICVLLRGWPSGFVCLVPGNVPQLNRCPECEAVIEGRRERHNDCVRSSSAAAQYLQRRTVGVIQPQSISGSRDTHPDRSVSRMRQPMVGPGPAPNCTRSVRTDGVACQVQLV